MKPLFAVIFTLFFAFSVFAQKQAEVIVTSTHLRKSPDINAEKVQTLQKGEKVLLERNRDTNGWYYVSVSSGSVKGWIRKDTIGSITNAEKSNQPAETARQTPQKTPQKTPQTPKKNEPIPAAPRPAASNSPVSANTPAAVAAVPQTVQAAVSPSPAPSPAEEPAVIEDDEVLRIETEEVSLNVRVVDGNNRPVNNLNQAHFRVYEDEVLQPITSLTTAEVPAINALVIDNSRSLRSQLKKVIEAGKIIIGTNRQKDESSIIRFVSSDKIEVVQDFTPNKNSLNNALDNLFVEGGQTAIIDAVYQTARKVDQYQNSGKTEDVKLRALILVSDGDDRGSSHTEQELLQLLRESNVQIYAIGFINDLSSEPDSGSVSRREKAKAFLTRLAQETGGKVYFPGSIEELPKIATDISGELRTQYLVSYSPTNENRDGAFRKIRVEIAEGANKEKRTAITRTGRNSSPK
ncbi:MAG: Mg-chelatase subunit ChlD [Acidobacteria bacterium]|nr:Mg-chelatase subunit ChlD [Acidobacteriota bacterium]